MTKSIYKSGDTRRFLCECGILRDVAIWKDTWRKVEKIELTFNLREHDPFVSGAYP